MTDEEGFVSIEDLKKIQRDTVTCSSGRRYRIRKVGFGEYAALGGAVDVHAYTEAAERMKRGEDHALSPAEVARALDFTDRLLCRGLRSIKLIHGVDENGDPVEAPPGTLHVADFPEEDKGEVVDGIMKLAGLGRAEQERVDPSAGTGEIS